MFSTTSPAEPKTHKGGGLYKQRPLAPGGEHIIIELRDALEG